ncbi:MAG: hypothetical protein B1H02_05590 [Candidatus Latescibacteria bacterium 4484_107]|nr:MAG: hypothetical protein B1H02_05590 [Candidatus Latescibacteria bacterium 4484_107]
MRLPFFWNFEPDSIAKDRVGEAEKKAQRGKGTKAQRKTKWVWRGSGITKPRTNLERCKQIPKAMGHGNHGFSRIKQSKDM